MSLVPDDCRTDRETLDASARYSLGRQKRDEMSAIGIVQDLDVAAARRNPKTLAIGSHAAYRPLHSRTQSPAFRDMPWEKRLKPLRPWNELGTYAFAAMVTAGALTFALV